MKSKELKVLWKVAKAFWIGATLIWIAETAIFLIIEGWHIKATHPIEKWFDGLVSTNCKFALNLTVFICLMHIFNLNKSKSKPQQNR